MAADYRKRMEAAEAANYWGSHMGALAIRLEGLARVALQREE